MKAVKTKTKIIELGVKFLSKFIPINENYIYFESFDGKGYMDNPKYIYEALLKQGFDHHTYIWGLENIDTKLPGNPIVVKIRSLKYIYYALRAKYWVANARIEPLLFKSKGTVFIQTWHGTPLKKLGFDIESISLPMSTTTLYRKELQIETERWDYLISPNRFSTEKFKTSFKFNKKILEIGYPRNDLLCIQEVSKQKQQLINRLSIDPEKKVILYAPTYRDNIYTETGAMKFNLPLDLKEMKKELGDDYIILLRMHYFVSEQLVLTEVGDFVMDVSHYPDISELYLISDILITDYSSVMFDYANLNRPILFYTYDLTEYRDKLRGFYFNFEEEAPGPLINTEKELYSVIHQIEEIEKKYEKKYKDFRNKFCYLDDGHSAERLIKEIWVD